MRHPRKCRIQESEVRKKAGGFYLDTKLEVW
jgi:hypothetical protein